MKLRETDDAGAKTFVVECRPTASSNRLLVDFLPTVLPDIGKKEIAEQENHHPEITLTWGLVSIRVWTHKIDGLTENDFILAAKISALEKSTTWR